MSYNFDEIIPREGTDCVKYDLRSAFFKSKDVIPMWVADMDFRTPDFIMEAIKQRINHPILGYSILSDSFYQSIINWMKNRHRWEIKREWITISPGIVPALAFCLDAFTKPGDKIIVQTPVYHPFFLVPKDLGRQVVENPLKLEGNRYYFDFDDLERKIDNRTRILFLSNPHNPVGRVWTKDELERIGEICLKHNIIILSDEIHSDLIFKNHRHIPLASISESLAQITITAMSPSKTFNLAGMHTAELIIPNPKLLREYNLVINNLHLTSGNLLGNIALEAAYTYGANWLDQMMDYMQGNVDVIHSFIKENLPMIRAFELEGTYLLWLDFRNLNLKQSDLNELMIKKAKIGLNDGAMFGTGGVGFQRMNIACPQSILVKALNQLKEAIKPNEKLN